MITRAEIEQLVTASYDLRGLTLWRPWPAAILQGDKRIENRPKPPPRSIVGKLIALHAGLTYDAGGAALMRSLGFEPPADDASPKGAIVGVARVVAGVELDGAMRARDFDARLVSKHASIVLASRWSFGRWCWVLDDVVELKERVGHCGSQGLWPVHFTAVQDVGVQLLEQTA